MTRLQIAVALYADIRGSSKPRRQTARTLPESASTWPSRPHSSRRRVSAGLRPASGPREEPKRRTMMGCRFEPRIHRPGAAALRRGVLRRGCSSRPSSSRTRRSTLRGPITHLRMAEAVSKVAALRGRADRLLHARRRVPAHLPGGSQQKGDLNDIVENRRGGVGAGGVAGG